MSDINELTRALGRIEGKVDALDERLALQHEERGIILMRHEERLSSLEKYKSYALGIAAAVSAIVGFGGAILSYFSSRIHNP